MTSLSSLGPGGNCAGGGVRSYTLVTAIFFFPHDIHASVGGALLESRSVCLLRWVCVVAKLAQSCIPVSMISHRKQSKVIMLAASSQFKNNKKTSLHQKKKTRGRKKERGLRRFSVSQVGIFPTRSSSTKRNCTGHIRGAPAIPELAVWKKS